MSLSQSAETRNDDAIDPPQDTDAHWVARTSRAAQPHASSILAGGACCSPTRTMEHVSYDLTRVASVTAAGGPGAAATPRARTLRPRGTTVLRIFKM